MSALDAPESSRDREVAEQEPKSEPQRKWLALVSVADLPGHEDDERAQQIVRGTDLLLHRNDPLLRSYLVLHPRVAPDPRRNDGPLSAYILAADGSGCILLQAVEGNRPDFFLCNTHTSTVTIIPPVSSYIQASKALDIVPILSIGLIADPHHRSHYVVAQLHPTTSNDYPIGVLYYYTAEGNWFTRDLTVQQGRMPNPFSETGVLAHDGRLWWIALAYGVFYCDPFTTQAPELRFLSLPPGCEMDGDVGFDPRIRTLLDQRRCVRLSEGKLRFVEIRGISYDDERIKLPAADPTVCMWTLDDPEGETPWTLEYEVAFAEIRGLPYADEGLQQSEMPHVALVDPNAHYVVYFLQGSNLFGVDMRENEKKVVACEQCVIDPAQLAFRSSRPIVDAWEVPPPPPTLPDEEVWSRQSYADSVDSRLRKSGLEWMRDADESWRTWPLVLRRLHPSSPAETLGDDVVSEILVRLPPQEPESLMMAALTCTQWGRIACSRGFRNRFRNFHSGDGPRLLGFFCDTSGIGEARVISRFVPEKKFSPLPRDRGSRRLDSLHGRVLCCPMPVTRHVPFENMLWVWCPINGEDLQLPRVRRCPKHSWGAALVCIPAADDGVHPWEHLACHHEPFRVVLVGADEEGLFLCIFSSDSGKWSPPFSAQIAPPGEWLGAVPAARVGNALCFSLRRSAKILSYDNVEHSFSVIERPAESSGSTRNHGTPIPISLQDGRLGLAAVYELKLMVWAREVGADGEAVWVQTRDAIELDKLLPLPDHDANGEWRRGFLVSSADGIALLFLWTPGGLFRFSLSTNEVKRSEEFDWNKENVFSLVPFLSYCLPALRGDQRSRSEFRSMIRQNNAQAD